MSEIQISLPQVKHISFEDYEKYFREALRTPDNFHILFYKKIDSGIKISFSWDNFIICCHISFEKIFNLYKDQNLSTAEVKLSDKTDHPALIKFLHDYLFDRGIPESD